MKVSQAYNEVREVLGPNVSDVVISKALKDNAYSVAGAINQIVDLTSTKSVVSYRTQQKGSVEVVDLLDEEEEEVDTAPRSAVKVVDSSSKRFRESPPMVLGAPFAKSTSLRSSSSSLSVPKASQTPDIVDTIWPKVLGRRSVDAESTYRGRPPPEMVAGSQLNIKRVANSTQKNKIVRLTTSHGTEIGRLPSALADILAPLLDAGCISCRVRVEFLPERLEIFTRFCITIEFCVNNADAFKCFEQAEAGESGDDSDSGSKRKRGFGQEDDDLADRFWKIIQLSFGTLTVEGVYKERLVKGAISLLEDDQFDAKTQSDAPKELSEDELFGNGKNAKLSDTVENDDSEVQSGLTVTLRSHQRIAVNWMKKREEGIMKSTTSLSHHPLWTEVKFEDGSSFYLNRFTRMATVVPPPNVSHLCKGGILADEMGLGKTIVVLGRVTQDINEAKQTAIAEKQPVKDVLEVEEEDEECGTLVIVVTSLLSQWEDEIDKKVDSNQPGRKTSRFSRFTYYGSDRDASSRLRTADIVLTTFGVVAAEHKSGNMTLFDVKWRRIVLDEAQSVRNADTLQAKAVLDLQADRRWCLSGTPVQNGIDDLFQLFRFIRLEPWGQRLWWDRVIEKPYKAGNPAALQRIRSVLADGPVLLRRTHKSIQEAGREDNSHELPPLKTEIVYLDLSPAERAFYDSLYNRSKLEFDGMVANGKAATSYVTILSLLIRLRQAADHPFLVLGRPKGDKDEEKKRDDEYIRRISAKYFSTVDKAASASQEQSGSAASSGFVIKTLRDLATNGGDCTICLCPMTDPVLLKCAHAFCRKCILDLKGNYYGGDQCPICRESFEKSDLVDIRLPSRENQISLKDGTLVTDSDELLGERFRTSSKLDRLVSEIQTRRKENGRKDKFLIFSQFTQMLDLCQVALSRMDPPVAFQRLDGSMSSSKRDQALKSFRDDPNVEALVMSLKAGCLGLNVTCANVVILLDPWWNAAVEHQAIGRAHRMGQTREVTVLRFIANNTVEVKMLAVQERKKSVASDTLGFDQFAVGGDDDEAKASSKLTLEDLREFFS